MLPSELACSPLSCVRSEGINSMAGALVHALDYVKVGMAQGATAGPERGAVLRDSGDGLLGVCRAAFQHCASCIEGVALERGRNRRNVRGAEVGLTRDLPRCDVPSLVVHEFFRALYLSLLHDVLAIAMRGMVLH